MIGKDTAQVFIYPPKAIKQRLARLRKLNPVKYAESKMGTEGLELVLSKYEKQEGFFLEPNQKKAPRH